jgi:serine protease Do
MFRSRPSPSSASTLALAALLLLAQATPLLAQRFGRRLPPLRNSPAVIEAFVNVVAKPSESTVRVYCDEQPAALGAIVAADGWIVTKASELTGNVVCKLKDGRSLPATVVGVEDRHDLAMLKVQATGLRPIEWRSGKSAEVGQWLAAPGPDREPVAVGVISVGVRKPAAREMPRTAPKSNSGYLGVILKPGDDGAPTVDRLAEDGPAERAGLKVGDVVLAVSGRAVRTTERLIARIQTLRPGQVVAIKVKRGEEEKEVKAKLDRFPQGMLSRGERMNMMGSELSYRLGGFPVVLQHDLLLKPSDCGGPVVDLDGKAVGINIARAGRTETYAIPTEEVQALLADLKSGKLAPKEDPEDRIADLQEAVKKLKDDLARAELHLKKVKTEKPDDARALKAAEGEVNSVRKRLEKSREELDKLRK